MGACLSCLGPRRHAETRETTTEPDETQPLLYGQSSLNGDVSVADSAKHQQDLTQIVQATHDNFIDITAISQPDLEIADENIDGIRAHFAKLKLSEVWQWPKVEPLTPRDSAALDAAFST